MFKDNPDLKDNKHLFMLCLSLGYKTKNKKPVNSPVGLLNVQSFSEDDLWTIVSIAVKEKGDLNIITDGAEMKKIAAEYAYGGLDELEGLISDNYSVDSLELTLEKIARDSLRSY